ncbi:hypothetical protein [Mycolicibacterium houstonense]|uniref:hypothetical protein n=1 Tax=Mycolicibacterium houstonense TaxID=146021 RepID=UPI000B10B96D|nr:hypothetical protein [Mycolicibacterium houstonense]
MANFAFFDYHTKVGVGGIQPAGTTRSDDAVFNRAAAANDLLTQWTPGLPPIDE